MILQTKNVLLKKQECAHKQEQTTASPKTVYIQAVLEGLDDPLIPFAVLKHDPLVTVRQYLEKQYQMDDMQGINDEQLYAAWNSLFTELKSEQNFFLYAWASVPGVSSATLQTMGLVFVIATPGPCYIRWVTTRPVWYHGAQVAWCVPVDMRQTEPEQIERILLSEKNMLLFASSNTWL
jgi:hypothetical protein